MTNEPSTAKFAAPTYGLSAEDLEALQAERSRMIESLVRTPSGRSLVRRACPDLDMMGRSLADEIAILGEETKGDDALRSRAAAVLLNDLMVRTHQEMTYDLYAHRSPLYRKAQKTHMWFDQKIRSRTIGKESRWRRIMARRWGWYGNAMTFAAAAVLAAFSWFAVAAVLIAVRILITAVIWSMASFPADDSPDTPVLDSDPRVCVLGHGGDLLLFASFGYALVRDAHDAVGFLVIMAGWIMILGTISRIGASASGYPVPRLHLERMVRGFSTCAAIALAAISSVPWWWSAVVMITLPTFFAWVEGREAWRAMRLRVSDTFEPIVPSFGLMPSARRIEAPATEAEPHGVI